MHSMTGLYFCGLSKNEWRECPSQGQYFVKKLFNYTRSCMETSHSFLVAQDGNGGSVNIMESVICHFMVRNCLPTRRQVMNSSPLLLSSLNNTILLSISSSIAMKQDSIFACYRTRHWLHPSKNQPMVGKKQRESYNQCLCKCIRDHQIASSAYWQS